MNARARKRPRTSVSGKAKRLCVMAASRGDSRIPKLLIATPHQIAGFPTSKVEAGKGIAELRG